MFAAIVFRIGVGLAEFIEAYEIIRTGVMIGLAVLAFIAFFYFVGFLMAHSVIFKTYIDISLLL